VESNANTPGSNTPKTDEDLKDSPVIDAFNRLRDFAGTGKPYALNEVYTADYGLRSDQRPSDHAGTGYEFERKVQVPDRTTDQMVTGTANFRILKLTHEEKEGTLFLRTRLTVTTSTGETHTSYAKYNLWDITVTFLARELGKPEPTAEEFGLSFDPEELVNSGQEPTAAQAEEIMEALLAQAEEQSTYEAAWLQSYPREPETCDSELEALQMLEYHQRVILAAIEAEPDLLCMLSYQDQGAVGPEELMQLLNWLRSQPENAGKL
jgi:hypothetical protein